MTNQSSRRFKAWQVFKSPGGGAAHFNRYTAGRGTVCESQSGLRECTNKGRTQENRIRGITRRLHSDAPREKRSVADVLAGGRIQPSTHSYAFDQVAQAHRDLERGQTDCVGKLVLIP
ncbi:MAG: zinc-binding dehydrogenase [Pseudomonadota bacterium]|nr:zinc-binding dehydrogenase [Pseudomonadota bacterium]